MKINLPNMLIVLRIVLIPVFLFFFMNTGPSGEPIFDEYIFRMVAVAVFLVAAISDFFDGLLARRWNTVSNFGKLMDPLADKMLVSAAMVALAYRQELAAWVVVIIICREFWVTSLRMLALEQGHAAMAASMWGKTKTVLQMVMLVVFIAGFSGTTIAMILMYLAVIATILSAVEYTRDYKGVFKK